MSAGHDTTARLDSSLSPEETAGRVRDRLDALDDVWRDLGIDDHLKQSIISATAKATRDTLMPVKRSSRRKSVFDKTDTVVAGVRKTIGRLQDLWDEIDLEEGLRLTRITTAYEHLERLLDEMVESETSMVSVVHTQCEDHANKVREMRAELGQPPFPFEEHVDKSLALWKALESEMKALEEQRSTLLEEQKEVVAKFEELATRLGEDPAESESLLTPLDGVVAPPSLMRELRTRLVSMEETAGLRVARLQTAQDDMRGWIDRMRKTDVGDDMSAVLSVDASKCTISESLLETVADMAKALREEYEEWREGLQFVYDEAMVRLSELWEICFVPEGDRRLPEIFDPASQSEQAVEDARAEVARLEEVYNRRRPVLDALAVWKSHWTEKIEYERNDNIAKYNDRGCNLQAMLKHQNALEKKLIPGAIAAVKAAVEEYDRDHPRDPITFDGMTPLTYIEHVITEREMEKEVEKTAKQEMKKNQLANESRWGTKTPVANRRRPMQTPASCSKLPKMARLGEADTTALTAHFGDTSRIAGLVSPTRIGKPWPKTSSPKGSRMTIANPKSLQKIMASSPVRKSPLRTPNRKL